MLSFKFRPIPLTPEQERYKNNASSHRLSQLFMLVGNRLYMPLVSIQYKRLMLRHQEGCGEGGSGTGVGCFEWGLIIAARGTGHHSVLYSSVSTMPLWLRVEHSLPYRLAGFSRWKWRLGGGVSLAFHPQSIHRSRGRLFKSCLLAICWQSIASIQPYAPLPPNSW